MDPVRTDRLLLRGFRPDDVTALQSIYGDTEVCRYLLHEPWTGDDGIESVARNCARTDLDDGALALVVEQNGSVVGTVSAWFAGESTREVELGWTFSPAVSGRGYAIEAVDALLRIVFAVERVHRVVAQMDARNTRSARLASNVGMRREALFRSNFWSKGEWTDTPVFAMLREEWVQLHSLPHAEFAFPGPLRDDLVSAIRSGRKTGTASLRAEYDIDGEPLPESGERRSVLDSRGRPVCVIETLDVRICALSAVDDEHARREGLSDLHAWRSAHEKFWSSNPMREALGDVGIDDDTEVVLEHFTLAFEQP